MSPARHTARLPLPSDAAAGGRPWRSVRVATLALGLMACAVPAVAGDYAFVAAPQRDLNRIYRVDRLTGEVGACQYGVKDDNTGVTLCYPAGEGAGKQEPGDYVLIASNHDKESAVFRVDQRTGQMSVCYVWKEQVICTPPSR